MTVLLAYLVFGEHLTAVQMLGGALVLGGVVALSTRPRPACGPAGAPSARAACHGRAG